MPLWSISSTEDALCPGSTPGAPLLPSESCRSILGLGVWRQENGEKMTAAEIYESMDKCMEENRGKNGRLAVLTIRTHARRIGAMVGRTEDDILRFYFKMRNLGGH